MRFAALACLALWRALAARQVAIVVDGPLDPPARYGIGRLEDALRAKGLTAVESRSAQSTPADFYVIAGIGKGAPQSLSIRRSQRAGKPAVTLSGGDARGLMYAALDTADHVRWNTNVADPFARVREVSEEAYLVERGVSIYTMQ